MDVNIVWFRNDLRIADNPALLAAAKSRNILAIYILDKQIPQEFQRGGASRYWLHRSLESLNKSLGDRLNFYIGNAQDILLNIVGSEEFNVKSVFYNKIYEPWHLKNDSRVDCALEKLGIEVASFNASLLWDPEDVKKSDGKIYKVFTPFYQNGCANAKKPREPLSVSAKMQLITDSQNQVKLMDLKLLPEIKWYQEMEELWEVGEQAAQDRLNQFFKNGIVGYKEMRNYPARPNTSRLSPHLHFGEISPQQIYHKAQLELAKHAGYNLDIECFLTEIAWREFSYYLLYHFPELPSKNYQSAFDNFSWTRNEELFKAWSRGMTGYPIIDAGMRELYKTGYMHNRVRMIVASFLVKNLMIDWREGARWFLEHLLDADLANNSASWQWVAGCGADAAPYFRIFNPILQGEKFDPEGKYIKQYVPELARLPIKYLFDPSQAPAAVLAEAGVILGANYPGAIIDLKQSRKKALEAYNRIKFTTS